MKDRLLYRIGMIFLPILFICSGSAFSQNQAAAELLFLGHEIGVGARAIGMGGAYVGVADDYSAVYWNPAGLGTLRRMEFNIGFSHNVVENELTFLGNDIQGEKTFTRLNSLGYVFPVPTYRGSLVFGVGFNKFRDYDTVRKVSGFNPHYAAFQDYVAPYFMDNFSENTVTSDVYQEVTEIDKGSLNEFVLSGAVEVQKDLMFGLSLSFINGSDNFSKKFVEEDRQDLHTFVADTILSDLDYWRYLITTNTDYSAARLKLGILYRMGNLIRLGATVTPPTSVKNKVFYSENQDEIYLDGDYTLEPYYYESEYEYDVKEPYAISAGASLKLLNVLLSAQIDFKDWSQTEFSAPPFENMAKQDVNLFIADSLRAVTKIRLGAEMYIPIIRSRIRAGYFNNPSPFKYGDLYPDKEYLTAGASIPLGRQAFFDLALVHGSWEEIRFDPFTRIETEETKTFNKLIGTVSVRF